MRNGLVYALHKTGVYRLLDECRDFAERIQSSRQQSFSQFGEDQFLLERFKDRKGFYIDIGGNHPIRGSNTYALYRNGWEGLVVEPIERFYDKQRRRRPRDIQVNAAVGSSSGDMTFYEMIPSVLSTCEFDVAKEVLSAGRGRLLNEYSVRLATVADLYRMQMSPRPVSLLCVDTEGHDLAVLQGGGPASRDCDVRGERAAPRT